MKKNILQIVLILLASVGMNGIVTAQIVVAGGASDVNGTYNNTFSYNGKPAYERTSGTSKDILWRSDVSEWRFTDGNGAGRYYYNTANTATPPDVGWMVGENGTAPAAVATGGITSLLVGDGTSGNPYQISSLNSLYWIANNTTAWDKHFIQTANIDASETSTWLSGSGWTPIGNASTYFSGSYNGDNFTIDGLTINRPETNIQGLFGLIFSGTIEKIRMTNVSIAGKNNVGAVTAYLYNLSTMTECSSTGNVSGTSLVGGLMSNAGNYSTVSSCYSSSTVTATSQCGGGLVGRADESTILNSYATGSVSANEYGGGLTGFLYNSTVSKCFSSGAVIGGFSLGGLSGTNSGSSVTNSMWDTETSGKSTSSGGTGKTTTEMKSGATFTSAGWDAAVWFIESGINNGYPYLAWQNPSGAPLPVEITEFTAVVQSHNVQLHWKTATEMNNYGFEIERRASDNAQLTTEHWRKVGFVEGSGTTNTPNEYSFTEKNIPAGKYSFRLKQIDRDGKYEYSNTVEANIAEVKQFVLGQNYPNPFNPVTKISYQLPTTSHVMLNVYDAIGREVTMLVNEVKEAGTYSATFDGSKLSSGVYFSVMHAGGFSATKRLLLVK